MILRSRRVIAGPFFLRSPETVVDGSDEPLGGHRFAKDAKKCSGVQSRGLGAADDHDRDVACSGMGGKFLLHITPAEPRQFDVQDHKVWRIRFDASQGVDSVLDGDDGVSADHQHLPIERSKIWIIFDHQNDLRLGHTAL